MHRLQNPVETVTKKKKKNNKITITAETAHKNVCNSARLNDLLVLFVQNFKRPYSSLRTLKIVGRNAMVYLRSGK